MKKNVLITMTYMHIGGGERSLLGLLHSFDYTKYDVDLFLFSHEGEFMKQIPSQVNLLPEKHSYTVLCRSLDQLKSEKRYFWYILKYIAIIIAVIRYKISGKTVNEYGINQYIESLLVPFLPQINKKKYDIALSFMNYHSIIKNRVHAKVRCGWFHNDYSRYVGFIKKDTKVWNKIDYIINVSDDANQVFKKYHPQLPSHKCIVIENILSSKFVHSQAEVWSDYNPYNKSDINILTVGRYAKQKRFDRAIKAYIILRQKYSNIKWYIIGEGEEEEYINTLISNYNLENQFINLGKKENPYPYIKECDIYVQPSDYEGKSVCVREAQILGKPVIITNYSTSASQIINGKDGLICDMSAESVASTISKLIDNPKLIKQLSDNCFESDYSNQTEINKLYQLIK